MLHVRRGVRRPHRTITQTRRPRVAPAAIAALAIEVPIFIAYAACWWAVGARPDFVAKVVLLGLGAIALGIQSSTMQRFGAGRNTTFLSGSLTLLVGQLATGHRFRDIRHHLVVLVGLVCGGALAALLVLHAPMFAPVIQLAGLAVALGVARWHARTRHRLSTRGIACQGVSSRSTGG